jgi:peptidoglycan-associated lipoprotein
MATVWVSALALGVLLAGCPKKKPVTVADDMTDTTPTAAPPPQEIAAPATPAAVDQTPSPWDQDLQTAQQEAERLGLIGDVYFDFDKYELKTEARTRLDKNAAFMRDQPQFVFTIEGHCDERGTNEYNLALGDRRANAARDYLVSLGVPASRIRTLSYGEERPFCGEHSEECWWRNRRGHFVISGKATG